MNKSESLQPSSGRVTREKRKFALFAEAVERERNRLTFADSHRGLVFTSANERSAPALVESEEATDYTNKESNDPKNFNPESLTLF